MMITLLSKSERSAALALLQAAGLPVADISENTTLYTATAGGQTVGTIGLEADGATGLLRSLSVAEAFRGKGSGGALVDFLEAAAKENGIQTFYLLTTTAAPFFAKHGYSIVSRTNVPPFIQQTSEFASVCPASATIMKKDL